MIDITCLFPPKSLLLHGHLNIRHFILISTLLTNSIFISIAQDDLRFTHYTTENGLSQGTIYRMLHDSRGFMWFGSWDGLIRFDGYDFKVFKPQQQDSTAIAGEHINSIVEDKTGDLWVGTNECLNRYNYAQNIFEH